MKVPISETGRHQRNEGRHASPARKRKTTRITSTSAIPRVTYDLVDASGNRLRRVERHVVLHALQER